ncbi:MAG: rhomboid family intramembrane serine protease [Sphingobium sp.]|nr:rhomboid family intramembrane serine protease [Sphingobium sp.]MCP5398721.1 rhomboid family intramembrane serine protease [Sphingomonas sp.]
MRSTHSARTTTALAGLIFIAHLISSVIASGYAISYAGGFIPARVGNPALLDHIDLGMPAVPLVLTPLSATLLHGGWLHLGFNLLILLYCGRQVETVLGRTLYLILYAAGAYAAAAGQWFLNPQLPIPMIGASGAISAIIGAYALLFSNSKVRAIGPIPASVVRMAWLGAGWVFLQFLIGVASSSGPGIPGAGSDGIAIGAHIGGFIAGMLLVRPMLKMRFSGAAPTH